MIHFNKHTIAGFLAVMLAASMVLALPLTAFGSGNNASEGTYEGEYDAEGKRSGYGTWVYRNFLYVGFWENDLPNGEGTLYQTLTPRAGLGGYELFQTVVIGQWVDGCADGMTTFRNYYHLPDDQMGYSGIDVQAKAGYPVSDLIEPERDWDLLGGKLCAGVPPMADVVTDSSLPTPEFVYDDSWTFASEADKAAKEAQESNNDDGTGVYEGEYDANDKRSGQGTWAYHNFLYVGNWKNDLPNGEGTLYRYETFEAPDASFLQREMIHGNWVDGLADGTVEWTIFRDREEPIIYRVHNVDKGFLRGDQRILSVNLKESTSKLDGDGVGGVVPFVWGDYYSGDSMRSRTPWDLYEMYPTGKLPYTPAEKIENTGMDITPGNMANSEELNGQMAALGDWIFTSIRNRETDLFVIYKMRADGSQMTKIHEGDDDILPAFRNVGDWLYVSDPYRMKADDVEFTKVNNFYFSKFNRIVDDWEYEVVSAEVTYTTQDGYTYTEAENTYILLKTKLDRSEIMELGSFKLDGRLIDHRLYKELILFADEDWVYVYSSNDAHPALPASDYVSQITKVKNDGSGEVEIHLFREGIGHSMLISGMPQFAQGRMYYMQAYAGEVGIESSLHSVDVDFAEVPVALIPRTSEKHISYFHVTDDAIYYGVVSNTNGHGAIMRVDLDGGNPTVLADGFETGLTRMASGWNLTGDMPRILIADDWMMFCEYRSNAKTVETQFIWHLMRLDGSDLHKLGDPFVPSEVPGTRDSTGKWRYELLADGSAVILGAGSKLKMSGKLAIPATVDKISVTAIGENAFYGCDGFTSVTIPKSITRIGDFAFFWCKGLTGVTIPEGVTHIGEGAFQWCSRLKKASLPASLTSISSGAFANCPAVKISVAKQNETFEIVDGALFDKLLNKFVD